MGKWVGVVVFDVDGVLADMSVFEEEILGDPPRPRAAWQAFFRRVKDAAVIDVGRELVTVTAARGYAILYSTTRPFWVARDTRGWLSTHGFPDGAVFMRPKREATTPAVAVKLRHCHEVRRRLRHGYLAAFVDDDPNAVTALCKRGIPARAFDPATVAAGPKAWSRPE